MSDRSQTSTRVQAERDSSFEVAKPGLAREEDRLPHAKPLVVVPPVVQPKLTRGEPLTVNPPNDRFEREADRVAEQVMRMPEQRG